MPTLHWPFRSRSTAVKQWANGVEQPTSLAEDFNEKPRLQHSATVNQMTPTTSTTMGDTLPPPIVQGEQHSVHSKSRGKRNARFPRFSHFWQEFCHRIGSGTAPSTSSVEEDSHTEQPPTKYVPEVDYADDGEVDEVVVDRVWGEPVPTTHSTDSGNDNGSPEKSKSQRSPNDDSESLRNTNLPRIEHTWIRAQKIFMKIFSSRFADERKERHYAEEDWYVKKRLAVITSLWWICNWVLGCIFVWLADSGYTQQDKIFYFGIAPVFSIPMVFMIMYDWPKTRPYIYQIYLVIAIWCWSFYNVIFINICGLYSSAPGPPIKCHNRDFMALFYYTTALQTIGFFALKLNRFPGAIGALAFMLLASITIIPDRRSWARSMINFFVYHTFIIYIHYIREGTDRRLYTLRDQLKVQFRATQRAQMNEAKASESKRRLTSYVFHEVRVPLNTALLAVQNMAASGTVMKDMEIEFNALSGSLSMMSKVLNDVLDFNRMDIGKFESVSRPYQFHQVMRSLFMPLRLATDNRNLKFDHELDPRIDLVARAFAYEALGETPLMIRHSTFGQPAIDGIVVGDEARLRQIVTNLASNACKFTPSGGRMTVKTRLVWPPWSDGPDPLEYIFPFGEDDEREGYPPSTYPPPARPLSADYINRHELSDRGARMDNYIVVRIEITDTGYGIRPKDIMESKLFSAFNQTEQGIQQGGKGTGLGLALVRQIVKNSGGRLGVKSKVNCGSTFWVELPLGVGQSTLPQPRPPPTSSAQKGTIAATVATAAKPTVPSHVVDRPHMAITHIHKGVKPHVIGSKGAEGRTSVELAAGNAAHAAATLNVPPDPDPQKSTLADPPKSPVALDDSSTPSDPPSAQDEALSRLESQTATSGDPLPPTSVTTTPPKKPGQPLRTNRPTYVALPSPPKFVESQAVETYGPSTPSAVDNTAGLIAFENAFANPFAPPSLVNATSVPPVASAVKGLNVLVVDDDMLTRMLMARILARLGCTVTTAENGEAAIDLVMGEKGWAGPLNTPSTDPAKQRYPVLEQARRTTMAEEGGSAPTTPPGPVPDVIKYAVVFLDNQMPVMSGVRAVQRLRYLGRKDFVVGVTGNALISDQNEYLEAGVDRVLTKPVLERNLRDILHAAEERRKELGVTTCLARPPSTNEPES